MASERATIDHPFFGKRFGVFRAPGRVYLEWRHGKSRPWVRGMDVLDVPSGEGLGLGFFRAAKSITCVDYDAAALERAKAREKVVRVVQADMTDLPFDESTFDCVTSLEGLEHLDKPSGVAFLAQVHRVVRKDGLLLLSCPLLDGVRHTGNEFHRHEWRWSDLRPILEWGFTVEGVEFKRFFAPIVFCRLRKKEIAEPFDWLDRFWSEAFAASGDACRRLGDWIQQQWQGASARLYRDGEPSLLPTCFAVLAEETLGIPPAAPDGRDAVVDYIQSQQGADGFFAPGEIHRKDVTTHSATYLRMQATYFAIHALNALGATPQQPIRFTDRLLSRDYLRGWLDAGPWNNPWLHSNNIMFALTFLEHRYRAERREEAREAIDHILDYLDERQDSDTGLWQPDDGPDLANAVFAAYHFWPYYFWRRRRPRYVDRIIDSVLSLQFSDGLFTPGGGACEDLDAVHTLVMMNMVSRHRHQDIRRALTRCYFRILQLQGDDGGFPNTVAAPRQSWKRRYAERTGVIRLLPKRYQLPHGPRMWRYSGWKKLPAVVTKSDMWSAWFRPLALRLIRDCVAELQQADSSGKYREIPGLGWHDPADIRSSTRQ